MTTRLHTNQVAKWLMQNKFAWPYQDALVNREKWLPWKCNYELLEENVLLVDVFHYFTVTSFVPFSCGKLLCLHSRQQSLACKKWDKPLGLQYRGSQPQDNL